MPKPGPARSSASFRPKRVADDVLAEPFHVLALAGEHPASAVHVEARVNPASHHPGPLGRGDGFCFELVEAGLLFPLIPAL
jgi:hypothetical protein